MEFTAPNKAGNYWVNCSLKSADGSVETLPAKLLKVVEPRLVTVEQKVNRAEIELGDTVLHDNGYYFDARLTAIAPNELSEVSATLDGAAYPPDASTSSVRFHLNFKEGDKADRARLATITMVMADGKTTIHTFYLVRAPNRAVGVYPENLSEFDVPQLGDTVIWSVGSDGPSGSVEVELRNMTADRIVSSATYSDPSRLQTTKFSRAINSYGEHRIRVTYSDGTEKDYNFSVPAPTPAPYTPYLGVSKSTAYTDESLTALVWSDHINQTTLKQVVITGPASKTIDMGLTGGSDTLALGMFPVVGDYQAVLKLEYSNCDPAKIETEPVAFQIASVPDTSLMGQARGDWENRDRWSAILASDQATVRQKAIATQIVDALDAIAGVNGKSLDPSLSKEDAILSVKLYLEETEGVDNPLTFYEWWAENKDWNGSKQQSDAKKFITNAPTSSISALLAYYDEKSYPVGSLERALIGGESGSNQNAGDRAFIADQAASEGGNVPDSLLLEKYRDYQKWTITAKTVHYFQNY